MIQKIFLLIGDRSQYQKFRMNFGNMPADGGEFLFTKDEKELFVRSRYIKIHSFRFKTCRGCYLLRLYRTFIGSMII